LRRGAVAPPRSCRPVHTPLSLATWRARWPEGAPWNDRPGPRTRHEHVVCRPVMTRRGLPAVDGHPPRRFRRTVWTGARPGNDGAFADQSLRQRVRHARGRQRWPQGAGHGGGQGLSRTPLPRTPPELDRGRLDSPATPPRLGDIATDGIRGGRHDQPIPRPNRRKEARDGYTGNPPGA